MPLYEYQCAACGHMFEILQRITEDNLTQCPKCHKNKLEKLVSGTNFQLKGSGWYQTDYSAKGSKLGTDTSTTSETKAEPAKTESSDSSSSSSNE